MKKYNIRKKLLSENGGAAVLVVFTIFTFLIVGMGAFMSVSTLRKSQLNSDLRIQQIYGEDYEKVDGVYEELIEANKSELEKFKISEEYATKTMTLTDKYENKIIIPSGFKVASDSGLTVGEGIVIEDNDITKDGNGNSRGNQYVWIPVGEITKQDGTKTTITLGRYVFADGTNHKDSNGNVLKKGTPILKQSAENYANETEINITEIDPTSTENYAYKELKINRTGVASSGLDGENETALNLKGFIDSVKENGGYYIARYEASYGTDGKANSKVSNSFTTNSGSSYAPTVEGALWNNITQLDAATASRNLYTTINSDLINSYAWDTAIVYIQEFSENTDYSHQNSKNTVLANTGVNRDEVCKINDMGSNAYEWTTEYSTRIIDSVACTCIVRGSLYLYPNFYTSIRACTYSTYTDCDYTFRTTLYM